MRTIIGLSFFAAGEWFIADVASVQKVIRKVELTPIPAAPEEVAGIVNMKGQVVTLLCMEALLRRGQGAAPARCPRAVNAVVFHGAAEEGEQMGFVMDKAGELIEWDESRTIRPSLGEGGDNVPVSGLVEADGALYRIVDPQAIIARFREGGGLWNGGPESRGQFAQGGRINEEIH